MGLSIYSFSIRRKAAPAGGGNAAPLDPQAFLEEARRLGAGGIQVPIGIIPPESTALLKKAAEEHGLYVEGEARLPRGAADVDRFDSELRCAREAGATVVRIAAGDRRYEQFSQASAFREFAESTWASLQAAAPIAERRGVRIAIENHKDFRIAELLDMLRRLASERVGACVDFANSIALLEDPMEAVEALAPWANAAHIKDAALGSYEEGILLGDVPLGEGILDLPAMVRVLRRARPELRFSLEMITRDPLKVPCLTAGYWATLPDVPARDLARTLALVRSSAAKAHLPRVGVLSPTEQLALEEEHIRRSLACAQERLEL